MVITSVSAQKKNNTRYNVFIDDCYAFSADYDDIVEFNIKEGIALDKDSLNDLIYKCQYKKAFNKAISLISIRMRSEQEIREKLKGLNVDISIIESVIARLKELDYINDIKFSNTWMEDRMRAKPLGKRKLTAELLNKGINHEIVQDIINQNEYDDYSIAMGLIEKKFGNRKFDSSDEKAVNKIYRYLLYRGIGYDTAYRALNNYIHMSNNDV